MLSKSFAVATLALANVVAVSAQTSSLCDPRKVDCPADPAVGKKGISCDFTKGECDAFENPAGKAVTYGPKGAVSAVDTPGQAPTLASKEYIFYGRVEFEMQGAPGKGIVSDFILISDDLDEIDMEIVGADNSHIQSNIFSKGDQTKHDLGAFLDVDNPTGASHRYAIDWNPDRIEWSIDGVTKHTLTRAAIGDRYPQTPMQVKFNAWIAGFKGNDPGTVNWAGGVADLSGGPASAYYKSVTVTDYAGGSSATDKDVKEYSYSDKSGSSKSIRIQMKDGSTSGEQTGGSGSSSSSTTATVIKTSTGSTAASASSTTATKSAASESCGSATASSTPASASHSTASESTMTTKTSATTGSGSAANNGSSTGAPASSTTSTSAPPAAAGASINGVALSAMGLVAIVALFVL